MALLQGAVLGLCCLLAGVVACCLPLEEMLARIAEFKNQVAAVLAGGLVLGVGALGGSVSRAAAFLIPVLLGLGFQLAPNFGVERLANPDFYGYPQFTQVYEPLVLILLVAGWLRQRGIDSTAGCTTTRGAMPFYLAFLAVSAVSVAVAMDKAAATIGVIHLLKFLVWYFAFGAFFRGGKALETRFFEGLYVFMLLQAGIGVLQFLGLRTFEHLTDAGSAAGAVAFSRIGGTVGRSVLDMTLGVVLPALLSYAISRDHSLVRRVHVYGVGLGFVALLLTGTRSAMAGAALGSVWVFGRIARTGTASQPRRRRTALLIVGACAAVAVGMVGIGLLSEYIGRATWNSRLEQASVALAMAVENPLLGVGINGYLPQAEAYGASASLLRFGRPVHSQYLLVLSESGILALAVYVAFLLCFFRAARSVERAAAPESVWASVAIQGSILSYAVISLFMVPFLVMQVAIVLAAFLAILKVNGERTGMCSPQQGYL